MYVDNQRVAGHLDGEAEMRSPWILRYVFGLDTWIFKVTLHSDRVMLHMQRHVTAYETHVRLFPTGFTWITQHMFGPDGYEDSPVHQEILARDTVDMASCPLGRRRKCTYVGICPYICRDSRWLL